MVRSRRVILLIESSRGFGRALLRGVANYVKVHAPWSFYHPPFFYMRTSIKNDSGLSRLKDWKADGIIARELSPRIREEIRSLGIPTVFHPVLNETPLAGAGNICGDHVGIGRSGAEHLLSLRLHHYAFCGLDDFFWSRKRAEGFREVIAREGFEPLFYRYPKSKRQRSWRNEQRCLVDWLERLPKPVGLMACLDERAQDVMEACKQARLRIPDEVAIVGADNDELICELSNPPLSSVALNSVRAGYEAAELLDKLMTKKKKPRNRKVSVLATHVVARQSTSLMAVDDPQLVKALRFIQTHTYQPVCVDDVANTAGLSKRVLQNRFRDKLSCSVKGYIDRTRLERITQMLMDTNMPVSKVASELGFRGTEKITRFFKNAKGMSPLAYRRKYGPK
ncbi:MAG: XylR family transcriptional regulator [Planctomycetota bacterium]